jgi:gliding motility-associated lipoprotein GldD
MRKLLFLFLLTLISCGDDPLPKPSAFLNLEYPAQSYKNLSLERPYVFDVSDQSILKDESKQWLKIQYPKLKASVDITYRKVNDNLRELLIESEKLVFKHTVKAEQISSNDYTDDEKRVFATLHEISGNAASQIQFHITDSTNHFVKGALYFKTKPNYDSVLPAVAYIKKDILRLMETFEWK